MGRRGGETLVQYSWCEGQMVRMIYVRTGRLDLNSVVKD